MIPAIHLRLQGGRRAICWVTKCIEISGGEWQFGMARTTRSSLLGSVCAMASVELSTWLRTEGLAENREGGDMQRCFFLKQILVGIFLCFHILERYKVCTYQAISGIITRLTGVITPSCLLIRPFIGVLSPHLFLVTGPTL